MYLSIKWGDRYFVAVVSIAWARRHDNGRLVSCGLTVGEDGFTVRQFKAMAARYRTEEISHDVWNHRGCQSSCVRRGAEKCQW